MLNGLDLFSGIGGLSLALAPWVKPIAYCEIDRYCHGVLLSRMADGALPLAPIWDDIRTLGLDSLGSTRCIDIIYGGFPCQDISVAGNGAGLAGERSGLFFEILRLIGEIEPAFVFLENVAAIRTRGGERVGKELAGLGYDCRWGVLSAFDVGAPHKRDRWFLLAHRHGMRQPQSERAIGDERGRVGDVCGEISDGDPVWPPEGFGRYAAATTKLGVNGEAQSVADAARIGRREGRPESAVIARGLSTSSGSSAVAHAECAGSQGLRGEYGLRVGPNDEETRWPSWWFIEPDVGRVANGVPKRVDRLRGLGNAVVPQQARKAFCRLMGIANDAGVRSVGFRDFV